MIYKLVVVVLGVVVFLTVTRILTVTSGRILSTMMMREVVRVTRLVMICPCCACVLMRMDIMVQIIIQVVLWYLVWTKYSHLLMPLRYIYLMTYKSLKLIFF